MPTGLPPPPVQDIRQAPFSLQMWYNQIRVFLGQGIGVIPWASVSKTGSNLNELATRNHNELQNIFGGSANNYYHWKQTEYTSFTDIISATTNTVVNTLHGYVLCDASAGNITITLPAASVKKRMHIKKIDNTGNTVTISPAGVDTTETALTLATQYNSYTIYSDGVSVWYIEGKT